MNSELNFDATVFRVRPERDYLAARCARREHVMKSQFLLKLSVEDWEDTSADINFDYIAFVPLSRRAAMLFRLGASLCAPPIEIFIGLLSLGRATGAEPIAVTRPAYS